MTGNKSTRGRKPDLIKSTKVRLEGSRKIGVSPRDDKVFAWLATIPKGERFLFAWDLLAAALNGELGIQMQEAIEQSDMDKAKAAVAEIRNSFVVDDDE